MELAQADADALLAAIRVLRDGGPTLGRPLVDTATASQHPNTKELRPGSTGRTEIRVLFAFDRVRKAILLVGGIGAMTGEAGTSATSRSPIRGSLSTKRH